MGRVKINLVLQGPQYLCLSDTNLILDLFHFLFVKWFIIHRHSGDNVVITIAHGFEPTVHIFKLGCKRK